MNIINLNIAEQPTKLHMGINVIEKGIYRGPHLYSHTPMVRIQIDLGKLEEWPTDRLPDFTDRLLEILPSLQKHGCSYGKPGGFILRLREGTWLGHVTEHIALELQSLAGFSGGTRGKTRSVKGHPGVYNVMYCYQEEQVGLLAGRFALELVSSLLPADLAGISGLDAIRHERADEPVIIDGVFSLDAALKQLSQVGRMNALGPTTASIVREAERRDIPVIRLDEESSLVQLGYGKYQKRIRASITGRTSEVATEIAGDKDLTKTLLRQAGLPVPKGTLVRSADHAVEAAEQLGYPVVIKPLDGNHGRGVTIGIMSAEQVQWAYAQARERSRTVIVEQQFQGDDHRILVIDGEVVATAKRIPAHVIGDGESSISSLIEKINSDPRRGKGHESFLTCIPTGPEVEHFLQCAGMDFNSIPPLNQRVDLTPTANLSTGGTAIDVTEDIHPDNIVIAERAAAMVGLDIAGIDFVSPDISKPVSETGGGIIEVNAAPGFRMHLQPSEGRPRNVARPVLDMLFPRNAPTRIPIFAITGTNGKSTTTRMLGHILREAGFNVGLTSSTGIYINNTRILETDASGPKSARLVLREPSVDVAVLETARGGILREGLGFEYCDVGAVLNIAADHLGLKNINTIEDMAAVKSVVVESVRRNGTSVLNADDPLTADMARHAGGNIAYFSMHAPQDRPEFLKEHIAKGGLAVVQEPSEHGGNILIHHEGDAIYVMGVAEIPATFGGMAEFNIMNALAAVAMSFAHGVSIKTIRCAMSSFTSSFELCPGRMNIFNGPGYRVILDYAHNTHGLRAVGSLVEKIKSSNSRAVGVISMAGDRPDSDMLEMGQLASTIFDELIFREDTDLRGRKAGEIAALLTEGALANGHSAKKIRTILSEPKAIAAAMKTAFKRDLIVITADNVDDAWKQITSFNNANGNESLNADLYSRAS